MLKIKSLLLVALAFIGVGVLNPLFVYAQEDSTVTAQNRILLADHTAAHCEEQFGSSGNSDYENCIAQLPADPIDCDPEEDATCEEEQTAEQAETCEERAATEGHGFGWLLCGLINGLANAIEGIFNWILGYDETTGLPQYCNLEVDINDPADNPSPGNSGDPDSPPSTCTSFNSSSLRSTWSAFRNLANAFFVLAFLYAIYQVAFANGNNAYLIRSMLPRLAAAVVLVQLSYFLVALVIDWSNELGRYVVAVFDWAFQGDFDPGAIIFGPGDTNFTDYLTQSFVIGGIFYALITAAGVIFATIVTMLIVVFMVLIVRKLLILVGVVLAPLAAIAWIHPQTDGFAKAWWSIFSKLLLMYPLIILLIKSGELMARATGATESSAFDLARLVAYFAPFFLIPFTFKFAGGMIGQIAGLANNTSRGFIDRGRNADAKRKEIRQNNARAKMRANQVAGKKNINPLTRMRAGVTFDSLVYGPKGGRMVTDEKLAEARSTEQRRTAAKDRARREVGASADVDMQQQIAAWEGEGKSREFIAQELEARAKNSFGSIESEAALRAIVTQRFLPELENVFDSVATNGNSSQRQALSRFKQEQFGNIDGWAAHITRGGYKMDGDQIVGYSRNYEALAELKPEQLVDQKGIIGAVRYAAAQGNTRLLDKLATTYANSAEHQRTADTTEAIGQYLAGYIVTKKRIPDPNNPGQYIKNDLGEEIKEYVKVDPSKIPQSKELFERQVLGNNKADKIFALPEGSREVDKSVLQVQAPPPPYGPGQAVVETTATQGGVSSLPTATMDRSSIPPVTRTVEQAPSPQPQTLTRSRIQTMTSGQIREYVQQQGGYQEMALSDLQLIAEGNPATEEVQQAINTLAAKGVPLKPTTSTRVAPTFEQRKQRVIETAGQGFSRADEITQDNIHEFEDSFNIPRADSAPSSDTRRGVLGSDAKNELPNTNVEPFDPSKFRGEDDSGNEDNENEADS